MKKITKMEYNTTRSNLILREYGRNFHKLVDYVGNEKDKEKRNKMSKTLVEMMKITQPSFKDQSEVDAKMWDDLYIMSDYNLDIDSPYPMPKRKSESERPKRLEYPKTKIRYRHYGKKIELLIEEACKLKKEDEKEKQDTNDLETSNGLENFGLQEEGSFELFEDNKETKNSLVDEDKETEEDELEIPAFLRRQKN